MCRIETIRSMIVTAGASLALGIASVVVAIGLNTNFFTSLGAPAPMAFAAAMFFSALAAVTSIGFMLQDYYRCAHPSDSRCHGHLLNATAAVAGMAATLALQASASLTLAGLSWIPWSIQIAGWVVVGGLIPLAATIATALTFINRLESCLQEPATGSTWGPLSVQSEIRGIIRWRPPYIEAIRDTDLLDVVVGRPSAALSGTVEGTPVRAGEFMQVRFVVQAATLNVPLSVNVAGRRGAFRVSGRISNAIEGRQLVGPRPLTLTPAEPTRSDLVFELYEIG